MTPLIENTAKALVGLLVGAIMTFLLWKLGGFGPSLADRLKEQLKAYCETKGDDTTCQP